MKRLNVDAYLAWRYDRARCNCWHIVQAGWREITGRDLGDRTPETLSAAAMTGQFDQEVQHFRQLPGPAEPSIVLMRHPGVVPHCGLFYRRRVLQMTMRGASYLPLPVATAGFSEVSFYQ